MKYISLLAGAALLLALPLAQAQTVLASSSAPPPPGSALPPPGINDPGVKPVPQSKSKSRSQSIPLPSTGIPPSVAPAAQQQNANGQPPPDVSVSTRANGDTVQTYSRNGQVYMVRVTPKHGVSQTYYNRNSDGNMMRNPKLGPVAPVYYTLFKWGGPKQAKPASASSGG